MNFDQARANMVEQQIRPWEVLDPAVLDLLYAVPREEFVPPALRNLAFADLERTGSGYLTALLAHCAAHVHSLEIRPALAAFGRANLERHGADNVTLEVGDGARGDPRRAPYDAIVLTGSTPVLPAALREQLLPGGRLFAVVGEPPIMVARLVTCSAPGAYAVVDMFDTVLAPLMNAEQAPRFRF